MELTKDDYLSHLWEIGSKIQDYFHLIEKGKIEYVFEIATKLRMMYFEGSKTGPLINKVCEVLNIEIGVWMKFPLGANPSKPEEVNFMEKFNASGMILHNIPQFWFESGDVKMNPIETLKFKDAIRFFGSTYSSEEIIKITTNKLGGAHIDGKVPDEKLKPFSNDVRIFDVSMGFNIVFEAAKATLKLISLVFEFVENGEYTEFIKKIDRTN